MDDVLVEAYPDALQARLEARDRLLKNLPPALGEETLEFVIEEASRWNPGQVLRVAFFGGTTELHEKIAQAAMEWTRHGNIALDFGAEDGYRTWSPQDDSYLGDIRIAFHHGGYWSMVGTDSVDESIVPPGEASMNFGGFDQALPQDWDATVLHEFGHALSFHHEHQSPVGGCDLDFRWEDDPGYQPTRDDRGRFVADAQGRRPGIYTVLGGPPNNWPQFKVDHNLRQLRNSHAFMVGPFDRNSIMKYAFPGWMFRDGESSHCFSARNTVLSDQDKAGIAAAYPTEDGTGKTRRRGALEALVQSSALDDVVKHHYAAQLEGLQQ